MGFKGSYIVSYFCSKTLSVGTRLHTIYVSSKKEEEKISLFFHLKITIFTAMNIAWRCLGNVIVKRINKLWQTESFTPEIWRKLTYGKGVRLVVPILSFNWFNIGLIASCDMKPLTSKAILSSDWLHNDFQSNIILPFFEWANTQTILTWLHKMQTKRHFNLRFKGVRCQWQFIQTLLFISHFGLKNI